MITLTPPYGHSDIATAHFDPAVTNATEARTAIRAELRHIGAPGMAGRSVTPTRGGRRWLFSLDLRLDQIAADVWPHPDTPGEDQ